MIQTHSSTEKKSFEELLQSQSVKGMQGKRETMKKVIVHKGKLPKPIDKLMKDQRVPIIWVSGKAISKARPTNREQRDEAVQRRQARAHTVQTQVDSRLHLSNTVTIVELSKLAG